jgi:hypothetical protein
MTAVLAWSDPASADAFRAETGALPRWANLDREVTPDFREVPGKPLLALVTSDGRTILQGEELA